MPDGCTPSLIVASSLAAAIAILDWWAVADDRPSLERWAKPLTMVALIGVLVTLGPPTPLGWWLVVGAVLGMIGDIALLDESEWRFLVGLGSFGLGHLAYGIAALQIGTDLTGIMIGLLVCAPLLGIGFPNRVVGGAYRAEGAGLATAVAAYGGLVGFTVVTAGGSGSWLALLGAVLFAMSDWVLGHRLFADPIPGGRLMVMIPYHLGQACLLVGLATAAP